MVYSRVCRNSQSLAWFLFLYQCSNLDSFYTFYIFLLSVLLLLSCDSNDLVRLGDMASKTRYVGLSEDTENGVWLDNGENAHSDVNEDDKKEGECNGKNHDEKMGQPSTSLRITTKYLNHTVLTLGYKLEEFVQIPHDVSSSPKAQLRRQKRVSMAYITDHEPYDHALAEGGFVPKKNHRTNIEKNPLINQQQPSSSSVTTSTTDTSQTSHSSTATNSPSISDTPVPEANIHLTADQSHAQFFENVDVLIHDCQYYFSEYGPQAAMSKENWGHSTVEYAVEVAFFSNVKQLLLFHHDPQRKDVEMDKLVEYARSRARELEEKHFGDANSEGRIRMKVDAAREGNVYELDPFVTDDDDDAEYIDMTESNTHIMQNEDADVATGNSTTEKQTVLLGFFQTEAETICDMLQSSNNRLNVKLLQSSSDILNYSKEKQPSVIVLDQYVFGCTGLEICKEIRQMGDWGKNVPLLVVASSSCDSAVQTEGEYLSYRNDQLTAENLNVEDYIKEPYSPAYLLTRIQMSILRIPLRWRRAPFPKDESQRLLSLKRTGLLDTDYEERFDRITRLAKCMFDVNISAVSLVDNDRQWFKSIQGIDVAETPRDQAFCAHAILEDDLLVVPDALQDERFADNPLVAGGPKIRFYAGCPIRVPTEGENKMAIGTLCVIDSKPRDLKENERRALRDFGAMVEREIAHDTQRRQQQEQNQKD